MELFLDTETSGMYRFKKPHDDPSQPWIVQLGFILSTRDAIYQEGNLIIQARDRIIEPGAEAVHCITKETANKIGFSESLVIEVLAELIKHSTLIVCHNTAFDIKVIRSAVHEWFDDGLMDRLKGPTFCTMMKGTPICNLPGRYGRPKWPKLQELHKHLFGEEFKDAHDALADVRATRRCYYEMTKEK